MDQFDAFQYFLTNLLLHNLVLVALALSLGVVLGRLMFGSRKVALDQLREALKGEEDRAKALGRELEKLQGRHAELLERVEAGDTGFSLEREVELEALRSEKGALEDRVRGMADKLEGMVSRQEELASKKAALEAELTELRESGAGDVAQAEVEKLLTTMQALEQRVREAEDTARKDMEGELEVLRDENKRLAAELAASRVAGPGPDGQLERLTGENERLEEELVVWREQVEELEEAAQKARQTKGLPARRGSKADVEGLEKRIAETIREREQVEKASAVLRMEMRGLRNKVKEIEQKESRESELEQVLGETEERLSRSQATVAKESRVRASLEKMVEDLEWKLADAAAERERLRDVLEGAGQSGAEDAGGGGRGAANALRGALAVEDEGPGEEARDVEPSEDEPEASADEADQAGEEDDLTRIKGIGAVLEKKLRAAGVGTFRQIADWTDEELAEFSKKLRLRNRAERDDWRGQAQALCDKE